MFYEYIMLAMQKDFDTWNEHKKSIHNCGSTKPYNERDIWWCSLGVNIGYEEDGNGVIGERPVLILKGFSEQVCLSIPLSTILKRNPYYISIGPIDGKEAAVIISQVRIIDTKRLINRVGSLNRKKFNVIRQAIKDYL